jgi:hypothetical protein
VVPTVVSSSSQPASVASGLSDPERAVADFVADAAAEKAGARGVPIPGEVGARGRVPTC